MAYDPTEGMSGYEKFMAGMGKAFMDPVHRVQQLTGNRSQAQIDEDAALDKPLMNTGLGMAGNIAGNVAATAPLGGGLGLAFKGAGALGRAGLAAASGAAQGATAPVTSDETAFGNIAGGTLGGLFGHGVASAIQGVAAPAIKYATPHIAALAARAKAMGIPITASQLTDSKAGQMAEKFFGNLPFGNGQKTAEQQIANHTRALTRTFGQDSPDAIAAVTNAKKALGATYDTIADRNTWVLSPVDYDKLDAAALEHHVLGGSDSGHSEISRFIQNIKDQDALHNENDKELPGQFYKKWRSAAGQNAAGMNAGSQTKQTWSKIQGILDGAFRESVPEDEASLLKQTDQQYANMKTVERALPTKGENFTNGPIDPQKMMAVMNSSANKNAANRAAMGMPLGTTPLADAAQVGNEFVPKPPVGDTGASHIPYADLLKSLGPSAALGVGAYFGAEHLAPDDSLVHKHPFYSAMGAAAAGSTGGATLGKYLLSQGYANGSPMIDKALTKLAQYGVPAAAVGALPKELNSTNAPARTRAAAPEKDPFAGMQEAPGPDAPAAPSEDPLAGAQEAAGPQ